MLFHIDWDAAALTGLNTGIFTSIGFLIGFGVDLYLAPELAMIKSKTAKTAIKAMVFGIQAASSSVVKFIEQLFKQASPRRRRN